ncbi:MAG TPA: TlpA disulfide reductase family protein [Tepidisphaeraceae bacterium]|nr:TlpA disulfide reductase family protein [Tepidisphaeraceae bacterium]
MKTLRWSIALAFLLAFSGLAFGDDDTTSLQGKLAPDFTLQTLDGKSVTLSAQKGSVVMIDMWATWCGPCRASLPHVQKISQDKALASRGLKVWAVNAKEEKQTAEKFVNQNNFTFTVPLDSAGQAMTDYKVTGIPTTVIVGRDGKIKNVFIGYGPGSDKQIEDALEAALKESGPST